MYSYQAIALADQNGRTYESEYGRYSAEKGFEFSDFANDLSREELVDYLLHEDAWRIVPKDEPRNMTKKEIEDILGYSINIEGYNSDKDKLTDDKDSSDDKDEFITLKYKKGDKEYDDALAFLNKMFNRDYHFWW